MSTTSPTAQGPRGPLPVLPADLLTAALRRDAAAPLITFYDDATDERVELSAATLANWVAKTANLLRDEFDVGPGSTVAVVLPVHWQTAAVLLAVWSCGAAVRDAATEGEGVLDDVDVVLVAQDRLAAHEEAAAESGAAEVLGLSLHPLGMGMVGYLGGARDFALEVRTHGDTFHAYPPPEPDSPGLLTGTVRLDLAGLVRTANELAARLGLRAGDRVLVEENTAAEAGPVAWLLAPLAAGASLVLYRHPAPEHLARRASAERVTATLGRRIEGIRELGQPS